MKAHKRIKVPDHPMAYSSGYYREHRMVMEKHLGRYLGRDEKVHHVDGNNQNNDISNLMLCSASLHSHIHEVQKRIDKNIDPTYRRCPFCKKYDEPVNMVYLTKNKTDTMCHKKCRQQYDHERYIKNREQWQLKNYRNYRIRKQREKETELDDSLLIVKEIIDCGASW